MADNRCQHVGEGSNLNGVISVVSAKKRMTSANAKRNGEGGEEHPLQETHQLRKRNE